MLDQLLNIVKQFGGTTLTNNNVPPSDHDNIISQATTTIASGLQNMAAGGGLQNIVNLFKSGNGTSVSDIAGNPVTTMMTGHFIQNLVSKFNLPASTASNVANNIIPNALHSLIQQTNDPSKPHMNLDNLIGSLTGGSTQTTPTTQPTQTTSGGGGVLQNLLNDVGGSGGVQNLISEFTQKAQSAIQGQVGGGGLLSIIKSFL